MIDGCKRKLKIHLAPTVMRMCVWLCVHVHLQAPSHAAVAIGELVRGGNLKPSGYVYGFASRSVKTVLTVSLSDFNFWNFYRKTNYRKHIALKTLASTKGCYVSLSTSLYCTLLSGRLVEQLLAVGWVLNSSVFIITASKTRPLRRSPVLGHLSRTLSAKA